MKRVGTCLYVHKTALTTLLRAIDNEMERQRIYSICQNPLLPKTIIFDIVKYDKKNRNISLISCPTWDIMNEPIVGDSVCIHPDGTYRIVKGGRTVYHNKWQFVESDYKGFDIEKAKARTEEWHKIPNVSKMKSKIGQIEFWHTLLKENGLEI